MTMFNANFIIVFLSCLFHTTVGEKDLVFCKTADVPGLVSADYYWREFTGVIPHDALPGGKDRRGFATYIGQAYVDHFGQLPASIYQGNDTAVTSAALKTYYVRKNVKILCSPRPKKLEWIPTDIDLIQLLTNCHLVMGGVDVGSQENIGRVSFDEQVILGKVIRQPLAHDGLWVPYNGSEVKFTSFEVLAYGCNVIYNLQ